MARPKAGANDVARFVLYLCRFLTYHTQSHSAYRSRGQSHRRVVAVLQLSALMLCIYMYRVRLSLLSGRLMSHILCCNLDKQTNSFDIDTRLWPSRFASERVKIGASPFSSQLPRAHKSILTMPGPRLPLFRYDNIAPSGDRKSLAGDPWYE